jgi:hypothetical protein
MHTYEADFSAWAGEQSRALAERRFDDLDFEHLVEEVEELGGSYRDQLESRILVLLMHLLKWEYQPEQRSKSWRNSIREQRRRIAKLLKKNPSLKPTVEDVTLDNFEDAVEQAMDETELGRDAFPAECPFTFDELMTFPVSMDEMH